MAFLASDGLTEIFVVHFFKLLYNSNRVAFKNSYYMKFCLYMSVFMEPPSFHDTTDSGLGTHPSPI